jgi:DinB superfamily
MSGVVDRAEAAEYWFRYIDRVPPGDICDTLEAQGADTTALLRDLSDADSLHRYAPGKWSIRELVGHLSDAERMIVFRAYWFARGFESSLPSFDQNAAHAAARAHERPWRGLIDEFSHVRAASVDFFRTLPPEAWARRGVASDTTFTVRALAYIAAGHVIHHVAILQERYLRDRSAR